MATQKTQPTDIMPVDFIHSWVDQPGKIADALLLMEFMQNLTGEIPVMWGPSIIGYGSYEIKNSKGKVTGVWPKLGFSPRKTAFSLYVFSGSPEQINLLPQLGKYTMGKACIYVKKLSDIDLNILEELIHLVLLEHQQKAHQI